MPLPADAAANQVVGWSYDAAGNLLNDGTTRYSYDARNRLTRLTQGSTTTTYQYTGDGVLVAATQGGTTTRYAQDLVAPLSQILQLRQDSTTTSYVYGHARLVALSGITQTWYGHDALGSVRQTLSDTGQPLTALHDDPWGVPQGSATPPTVGFTGELQEPGGLVYLRARWYQPQQGRFLSRDRFQGVAFEPQSLHVFTYVHNNPVVFVDPTGEYLCSGEPGEGYPTRSPLAPPRGLTYRDFCAEQAKRLDAQLGFDRSSRRIATKVTDALGILIDWFTDPELPGGPKAKRRPMWANVTAAAERLEFTLWYTGDSHPHNSYPGHFAVPLNDTGFSAEFRDGRFWPGSSNQVGHFLTAVDLAYRGISPKWIRIACIVGHEMVGDDVPGELQCGVPSWPQLSQFKQAAEADLKGDHNLRDCFIAKLLPDLPEYFDPIAQSGRSGNSRQDLRLSVKGWNFGQLIRDRRITTLDAAVQWLRANLRPKDRHL